MIRYRQGPLGLDALDIRRLQVGFVAMFLLSLLIVALCQYNPNSVGRTTPGVSNLDSHMRPQKVECIGKEKPRRANLTEKHAKFLAACDAILPRAVKAFKSLNISFWPMYGTLLGWYRDCDFLPHEHDVDFGMWASDFSPQVVDALRREGMGLYMRDADNPTIHTTSDGPPFFSEKPVQVLYHGTEDMVKGSTMEYFDIWLMRREPEYYWGSHNWGYMFFDWTPFVLCPATFNGIDIDVPCNVERMMNEHHGPGDAWRVPYAYREIGRDPIKYNFHGYPEWLRHPLKVFCFFCVYVPVFAALCVYVFRKGKAWYQARHSQPLYSRLPTEY